MNANLSLRRQVAERLFGDISESANGELYIRCPGIDRHTGRNAQRDCRLNLDGVPGLFCLHTSCSAVVEAANHEFRSAIGKVERGTGIAPLTRRKPTTEERRRQEKATVVAALRERTRDMLPTILREHTTDVGALLASSPVPIPEDPTGHWRLLLHRLFPPTDVVWIGERFDSGKPKHIARFRTTSEWLAFASPPGPLTVPASFKAGSIARTKANVLHRRYLVIESDKLSKPETLAIFGWCRQFMPLRAAVDTGGKSIHGWFDATRLPPERLEELRVILPELGADPALFREAQPCRLPGWEREPGRFQRLLYLDDRGAHG